MSAVESALDVLSRAATMVQGQFIPLKFLATRVNFKMIGCPEDVSSFSEIPILGCRRLLEIRSILR